MYLSIHLLLKVFYHINVLSILIYQSIYLSIYLSVTKGFSIISVSSISVYLLLKVLLSYLLHLSLSLLVSISIHLSIYSCFKRFLFIYLIYQFLLFLLLNQFLTSSLFSTFYLYLSNLPRSCLQYLFLPISAFYCFFTSSHLLHLFSTSILPIIFFFIFTTLFLFV